MGNSLIQSGNDDGFNNVPLTGRGAMRGSPITYNAADRNYWRDRVDVANGEKLVVLACRRGYQYWPLDGSAPQLLLDEPGSPHPDRKTFGDQDESKWRDGPNGKSDPYTEVWVLYFARPDTGSESTFITSTAGGSIAVEILVDEIRKKRRRAPDAYPVVRLEDTKFPTRYGLNNRPHFAIVDWVFPGGEHAPAPDLPKPAPASVPPAPATATPPTPRGRATIASGKAKVTAEAVASGVNPLDDIPFDL
jgi:hypothetical protein